MYSFKITKSDKPNKKYTVVIYEDGVKRKTLHIGDSKYKDYIQYYKINPTLANERKRLYYLRHKNEDKNDFMKSSFWAFRLLWDKTTLKEAISSINLNK